MKLIQIKKILKQKKAQGLPISTIILVVIGIVVLAALLLFFFSGFGKPTGTLSEQQILSKCQGKCSIIASSNPTSDQNARDLASNQGFCDTMYVGGVQKDCTDFINCYIESVPCTLGCDEAYNPTC